MPADRQDTRRSARKSSGDEDIEVKRARGEISCAECRRLKLKCDKKLPCGSCVRRGCTTICPNGSLSAGQGTRFILADTEQLHRKISEMSERIRQLEDALAIFQAGVSNERHPLLKDEFLTVKFGPEVRRTVDDEVTRDNLSKSIDALGTLTIGDHGETKYFGRSGGSETLFLANTPEEDAFDSTTGENEDIPSLATEFANFNSFPYNLYKNNVANVDLIIDKLETFLPPQPRAWALCEAYLAHFTWWCRPLKRDELIDDVLIPIYNSIKEVNRAKKSYNPNMTASRRPHLLAVLYMVLAVGALLDLTLPQCSIEAETYYRLGRSAMSLRPVYDSAEVETVQAVVLMAGYHSLCSQRYSVESAWTLISMAMKLAQSLTVRSDRDSAQWNLDVKSVERRRNLFWEIHLFELIHCIALGRPPTSQASHIDCEIPADEESSIGEDGDPMQGFWHFKHEFSREIYSDVVSAMLCAKAPTYATILDLDRSIRQMALPPVRLYLRPDEDDYSDPALCMKSYLMSHYRSITMIHIHRTFFAQALLDHPESPLSSPYAPSFLAANRCASILVKSFIHHHERSGELCSRFWSMWTHAFSSAVILGTTVARIPHATMAPSALMELDLAVELFKKGAVQSVRARQALPVLVKLKERAVQAYTQFRNRHIAPTLGVQFKMGPEDQCVDELAIFGGQTRVLASKVLRKRSKKERALSKARGSIADSGSPPESPATVTSSSDSGSTPPPSGDEFTDVHPSLMDYLSQFRRPLPSRSSTRHIPHLQTVPELAHAPPMAEDVVMNDQWSALLRSSGMFSENGDMQFTPGGFDPTTFNF
ncbi:fungal-specific transcription factor domain-containing protein [Amylocystis lapponica]|nr:fungal-specific transcription factor domain-containing protein [Amylocystis lapponica]